MKKIYVNTQKPYKIFIENGGINHIGEIINKIAPKSKVFIICDDNLFNLYFYKLTKILDEKNINHAKFIFKPGESFKNFATVNEIYKNLAKNNINKNDMILAFGGGVCGDMAGFAASTYMRGIKLIQVPTSLIAMVDSAIGGKTGINLEYGKNLVGAFYSPQCVLVDPDFLKTLPQKQINQGFAEILKYSFTFDKNLFLELTQIPKICDLSNIIFKCINLKRKIIEKDEFEQYERMLLNFGHTFGHALEKIYNFKKYSHGEAVAIGMAQITKISEEKGITRKGTYKQIKEILKKYDLPTEDNCNINIIKKVIMLDKKNKNGNLNLILLKEIGHAFIFENGADLLK